MIKQSVGAATVQAQALSHDLLACVDEPNWAARAKCVERIARLYCDDRLDPAMRRAAEDAFRRLRFDCEIVVRRLLAESLKREAGLPRDIAFALASDKAEVAYPFLVESPALGDADLMAILRDHPGAHRLAIARRRPLSEALSDALCRCGEPGVAATVLANDAARVSAPTIRWLLDSRPDSVLYQAAARRRLLLLGIADCRRGTPAERAHPGKAHNPHCERAKPRIVAAH